MEQIKAEKKFWHRTCFRCAECSKQLKYVSFNYITATSCCYSFIFEIIVIRHMLFGACNHILTLVYVYLTAYSLTILPFFSQLFHSVDTYQSHEGILYCKPHFKTLFAPKAVEENNEPVKPRKLEMIILENQPIELPPDVVRVSSYFLTVENLFLQFKFPHRHGKVFLLSFLLNYSFVKDFLI